MADPAREAIPARAGGAEPLSERRYSGKFNLRLGEKLHREVAAQAAEENLSLNQWVVRRLTTGI